jgi:hypothetical protein
MADVTRVHGDAFGVVNVDRGSAGDGAISADELVVNVGRSCKFFGITVYNASGSAGAGNIDLRNELDPNEAVSKILQTIQSATVSDVNYGGEVLAYQVEGDANGQISVMVAGSNWTSSAMQTAIRALGTTVGANTVDVSGTDVTDTGFKLATS